MFTSSTSYLNRFRHTEPVKMTDAGQTRFLRCKVAAFDVFTDIMREYMVQIGIPPKVIFENIMKCSSLKKTLNSKEFDKIQTLEKAGFKEFDISLMYKIVKHQKFAMIIPDIPTRKWGSEPLEDENTIGDNIMRIYKCRNDLAHKIDTTILESEFKELFEKYIDIGRRADSHLSKSEYCFRRRIEKYKTCCIDKDMEEKMDELAREIEDLLILVRSKSRQGVVVVMVASTGTQIAIEQIQATGSFEGTSSAELRIPGLENSYEKAELIYERKDDINTDKISIKRATDGSLLLFLAIKNSLFQSDKSMETELKSFIDQLFNIADLRCTLYSQCNVALDMENENDHSEQKMDGQAQVAMSEGNPGKPEYQYKATPSMDIMTERSARSRFDIGGHPKMTGTSKTSHFSNSCLAFVAVICVIAAVCTKYAFDRASNDPDKIVVTPLNIPKINLENSSNVNLDSDLFWGTYRSNLYFGMKTRSPKSPVVGLMWFEQYIDKWKNPVIKIRHWCDQGDYLKKYGWLKHDGKNFGVQEIVENNFKFNTSFVKRPGGINGGDWSSRITAIPIDNKHKTIVSFLVYLAVEGEGNLLPVLNDEDRIDYIKGSTRDLGHFVLKFPKTKLTKKVKFSHIVTNSANFTQLDSLIKTEITHHFWTNTHFFKSLSKKWQNSPNFVVYQVTAELPVEFDIVFESKSFHQRQDCLTDNIFTRALEGYSHSFDERFSSIFQLETKGFNTRSIEFAKAGLSNLLGEISYFYGSSRVKSVFNKEPIDYWSAPLYTSIPSRSIFPRGFLWNVGFDNLLISLWNSKISEEIIAYWLDLLNIEGWFPREQILGHEARAKVPEKFVVQENGIANPPTFFLTLQNLIARDLTNTTFLKKIFPRLKVWFNWLNTSQVGEIPTTFYWRGRNYGAEIELIPKTSSSGLDDYPRASHPSSVERHLDLRCWIAIASGVLSDIAKKTNNEWHEYDDTYQLLMNNEILDYFHWSPKKEIYSDYGFHTDDLALYNNIEEKRILMTEPRLRFIDNSFGYVSLFPLMLKIIDPNSPKLQRVLKDLLNPQLLWTCYGLRSLATTSPFYLKKNSKTDNPSWRGSIWINMNYLVLSGLNYYSNTPGKYQTEAAKIYKSLRNNLVTNVMKEYYRQGYLYEKYNDKTGEGEGCHPFSGWSALIVAIMAEIYV
ncbi:mannosyl-oligosaccharide glucosidase-like [Mytilus californianus]|uniref:mannosyl-oligosaccharide glucosidase-like n=1 Tax=Mytilus californianus TaxID=6549 RepID=UPI0022452735|nr:mannosyl-oligosaccharide glucosidase-like [Mytilus californianus]